MHIQCQIQTASSYTQFFFLTIPFMNNELFIHYYLIIIYYEES